MRIASTLALLLLALTAPALAELSDEEFVTRAFGTVAVLHAPRQVVDPSNGWWGDKAAPGLTNPSYLVGIINSRRMDRGDKNLLDPNDATAVTLEIEETDAAGFRYPISFAGMRASEVQDLVGMLGGAAKMLPGATEITYEPLQRRSLFVSSYTGAPVVLQLAGQRIEVPKSMGFDELHGAIAAALQQIFAKAVPFDLTLTRSSFADGSGGTDISVFVDLNPPPPPAEGGHYEGEGGM